ncbi:MAG TPA: STM4011 family radical SAM protein [Pirellulales bacterium]|nr:STM4011 family radical SAM protein [Pirellulales bacterium]
MNLSVLYRGSLVSCNYACGYCPFAKHVETSAQLTHDRQALRQFTDWLGRQAMHRWRVLFTPYGEALVRPWYRHAVVALTHHAHLKSVAVQTNLSCSLDWVADCRADRLTFWATYHPTETNRERFLRQVRRLRSLRISVSVGMVGVPGSLEEIRVMRGRLPEDVYLWINAQQPRTRPYTAQEEAAFQAIDPQFLFTARRQPSLGKLCASGEVIFTVDGRGDMRRCHFIDEVIGNIHDCRWEEALRPRRCPRRFCDCFLGKAQLRRDALAGYFGQTVLERLPIAAGLAEA